MMLDSNYLLLLNNHDLAFRMDNSNNSWNGCIIHQSTNSTLTTNCNFHIAGTQTWSDHITWDNGVNIELGGECSFNQGSGDTWSVWNTSVSSYAHSIKCPWNARVEIGECGDGSTHVGLYVYGDLEVGDDLVVNDCAHIDALHVGTGTDTDPGDNNAVINGNLTASTLTGPLTGNASSATTAGTCTGNSATATTAGTCTGNSATATTAGTVTTAAQPAITSLGTLTGLSMDNSSMSVLTMEGDNQADGAIHNRINFNSGQNATGGDANQTKTYFEILGNAPEAGADWYPRCYIKGIAHSYSHYWSPPGVLAFGVSGAGYGGGTYPNLIEGMRLWCTTLSSTPQARLGIMTTTPAYTLDVTGTIRATQNVIAYSDVRDKENIDTISGSLGIVNDIRGVRFDWNDEYKDKHGRQSGPSGSFAGRLEGRQIGVIAQEVEPVLPELVFEDDDGRKNVSYANLTAVLVEAVKEQQEQIEELKQEVKEIKNANKNRSG
jgi:hypothetical protein